MISPRSVSQLVLTLSAVLATLAGGPGSASARTWTVYPDGSGETGAETIQYAVWSTSPGDTVLVMPGTYNEANDNLHKSGPYLEYAVVHLVPGIVLRSSGGPEVTIMDAHSVDHPETRSVNADVAGAETVIEGFTITGGHHGFGAGGIQVWTGTLRVRNCVFQDCYGGSGGTMKVFDGGQAIVEDCVFDSSFACCGVGGAVTVLDPGSSIELRRNTFLNSTCWYSGGALAFFGGATGVVEDNEFVSCTGTQGGAIYVDGSSLEIRGNVFRGNRATGGSSPHGGALAFVNGSGGLCENNVLLDNLAEGNGGGIYVEDSSPEITHATIHGSSAANGGGLYLTGSSAPVLTHLLIAYTAGGGGVGVDASCTGVSFSCSDVFGNVGGNYVGITPPTGQSGNTSVNPLFCEGEVTLQDCSPLRADSGSGCGQVGALGVDCVCAPRPPDTWSAVKWFHH